MSEESIRSRRWRRDGREDKGRSKGRRERNKLSKGEREEEIN